MTMPFYVAPEQVMKDRADYARKGIARGRALVAVRYVDGIAIVAENSSESLRKVSEIYDRIAFAGVGRYNEYDQLRVAGVRAADLKGFQYSRDDVDARSLANQYAQILGQIFTHEMKPMEVEILVAEVGTEPAGDQMYHILYDGTVVDERDYSVLGGDPDAITARLIEAFDDAAVGGLGTAEAIRAGVAALSGPDRELPTDDLEVALLCRGNGRRCFRRLTDEQVAGYLAQPDAAAAQPEPEAVPPDAQPQRDSPNAPPDAQPQRHSPDPPPETAAQSAPDPPPETEAQRDRPDAPDASDAPDDTGTTPGGPSAPATGDESAGGPPAE